MGFEQLPSWLVQGLNSLGLVLLLAGVWKRRTPRWHVPLVLCAGLVDLVNVVIVEFRARAAGSGAVEQGMELLVSEGAVLPHIHVAVSVLCVLGYVVALTFGVRLLRQGVARTAHRRAALFVIVMRIASYVTSFWM